MGKPGIEGDRGKHGEKVPYDCIKTLRLRSTVLLVRFKLTTI